MTALRGKSTLQAPVLRDHAVALREAGATIGEIAETLKLPRSTVGDMVVGIQPLEYVELVAAPIDPDAERLALLRMICSRCRQRLPWSAFWAKAKWPDGTMRRPQSHCKECVKARLRERRAQDPEWAREVNRRDWERIKADPEKLARRRELTRENLVVHRLRRKEAA